MKFGHIVSCSFSMSLLAHASACLCVGNPSCPSQPVTVLDLVCSENQCQGATIQGCRTVKCEGDRSCKDSTIANNAKAVCTGKKSCKGAVVLNVPVLKCKGENACDDATLTVVNALSCTGASSCDEGCSWTQFGGETCSGDCNCQVIEPPTPNPTPSPTPAPTPAKPTPSPS